MLCKKWLALNWRSAQLCILGALLCAVMPVSLMAQMTIVGRISGTVTDASQSALPGATVAITNEATGLSRTLTTDQNGSYVATNLPVGSYRVSAEQKGFGKESKAGYRLDADGRITVDFMLKPGGVTETDEDEMAVTTSLSASPFAVNGVRTDQNLHTVDGGFNLDSGSNGSLI